jgi:hypothetical protein
MLELKGDGITTFTLPYIGLADLTGGQFEKNREKTHKNFMKLLMHKIEESRKNKRIS